MDLLESDPKIDINHWYYYSKFKVSLKILNAAAAWPSNSIKNYILVDVGAGSGIFIKAFFSAFSVPDKKAYAIDKYYKKEELGNFDNIIFCKKLPKGINPSYFFFMDILEHVDDDVDFLKRYVELAPPGSIFLFTVPAFKWLWSEHDLFLKHKKRYSLKELEKTISTADLVVLKAHYFYAIIFPLAFLKRKIVEPLFKGFGILPEQGIKPSNNLFNGLLKTILKVEILISSLNRFFGLTCIAVAKKVENTDE